MEPQELHRDNPAPDSPAPSSAPDTAPNPAHPGVEHAGTTEQGKTEFPANPALDANDTTDPSGSPQQASEHAVDSENAHTGSEDTLPERPDAHPVGEQDVLSETSVDAEVHEPTATGDSDSEANTGNEAPPEEELRSGDQKEGDLQSWWAEARFPGKELVRLEADGTLMLLAVDDNPERPLVRISTNNGEAVIHTLIRQFADAYRQVTELEAEWNEAEDRSKLFGKVATLRDYINEAKGLGDYRPLLQKISGWEAEIKQVHDAEEADALAIVTEAESLVDSDEWRKTATTLTTLSERWRALPYAGRHRHDALYKRFSAAKDQFFERKRKHTEEIEQELSINLDKKLEIIEKAENLAASEKWRQTTEALHQLTEEWKQIGRVPQDRTTQLWERFSAAKDAFFERKRQHFQEIEKEQDENLKKKEAILEEAEKLAESTDWNRTTQHYARLMDEWKKVGRVPAEKTEELWQRLNAARDTFFNNKRQHADIQRVELEDNLARKMALVKRAESLKNSTLWREVTDELNQLMDDWKNIGPVPREHNNAIWEQFLGARKFFFQRKDADRNRRLDRMEAHAQQRAVDARRQLERLRADVKEEEEKIADFRQALLDITPGPKAEQLRAHLETLIPETEKNLARLQQQLARAEREAAPKEESQGPRTTNTSQRKGKPEREGKDREQVPTLHPESAAQEESELQPAATEPATPDSDLQSDTEETSSPEAGADREGLA